jgi:hypothetical protein
MITPRLAQFWAETTRPLAWWSSGAAAIWERPAL